MPRHIHEHEVNPGNRMLNVTAVDDQGHGSANHHYDINSGDGKVQVTLKFQNGPINVDGNGVNGVTHEALLAVVADRLRCFQAGPYACKENACALTHIEEAMQWLHSRTLARMRRNVEGTHEV